jgi:hypothetical protein
VKSSLFLLLGTRRVKTTPEEERSDLSNYTDPIRRLRIITPLNITSLVLRDINFAHLSSSTAQPVNFSSIKKLYVVNCLNLQLLWEIFMLSDAGTNIEELLILIFQWEQEHQHHEDSHRFEPLIKSFSSLRAFGAKICGGW